MKKNLFALRRGEPLASRGLLAALTAVVFGAGCASAPPPMRMPSGGALEPGSLTLTPGIVAKAVLEDLGLCTKEAGPLAACTPRPGVKRVLSESLQPALKELVALPLKDRPAWLACHYNFKKNDYECVDIYELPSR